MKQFLVDIDQLLEKKPSLDLHLEREKSLINTLRAVLYSSLKRLVDILGSLLLLSILLPVMVIFSVLVRISSPGPAIYCQRRLTEGGRIFTIFKFRTMNPDAEANTGAVWAMSDDPRITKIGSFMRKTRIDELPQLLNILIGDMSLVGPRPERPVFAKELSRKYPRFVRRTDVKAGLTGLAQVSSGYASSVDDYREKLAWDLLYVKHRSIWLDIQILLRTITVVLRGTGAR